MDFILRPRRCGKTTDLFKKMTYNHGRHLADSYFLSATRERCRYTMEQYLAYLVGEGFKCNPVWSEHAIELGFRKVYFTTLEEMMRRKQRPEVSRAYIDDLSDCLRNLLDIEVVAVSAPLPAPEVSEEVTGVCLPPGDGKIPGVPTLEGHQLQGAAFR